MMCCRLWSTFWGGSLNDNPQGLSAFNVNGIDRVIVAGFTLSVTPPPAGTPYPSVATGIYSGAFTQATMPVGTQPDGAILGITFAPDEKLSIDLASFGIAAEGKTVRLNWRTASEENNDGFIIERAILDDPFDTPEFTAIESYVRDQSLSGLGTSPYGKSYSYVDRDEWLQPGKFFLYRLVDVSHDGIRTTHPALSIRLEAAGPQAPVQQFTAEVSPNPATEGFINLNFSLQAEENVTVEIYSADGKKMATPISEVMAAGSYSRLIKIDGLAPGVYTAMVSTGNYTSVRTRQFVVVR
jgi:hypothetical protein